MKSVAIHHFPPVVYRRGLKKLWNRLERKALANRPEERVRLRVIDYLTLECGWPASRIATETAVRGIKKSNRLRADIICFDKAFNPAILIECKAETIPLTQAAARQIGVYNRDIRASKLCITNGMEDAWYERVDGNLITLDAPPAAGNPTTDFQSRPEYWVERGFGGTKPVADNPAWLTETLQHFWSAELPWMSRYLDIHHEIPELPFAHYYRVAEESNGNRIAMSFAAEKDGDTCLTAIYNQDGQNRAVMVSNLNQAAARLPGNSTLITSHGKSLFNLRDKVPFGFKKSSPEVIDNLPGFLSSIFHREL